MKTFLIYWIVVQLVLIGLVGGGLWRDLVRYGCIEEPQTKGEIGFSDFIFPVAVPLIFLTGDVSNSYCEK